MQVNHKVPSALRIWFVIHFAADIAFAIPLFVAPRRFLALLGWTWLGRNEPKEVYLGMLNLKIIWSLSAALGLAISIAQGGPLMASMFLFIFAAFCGLWSWRRVRLARAA